MLGKIVVEGDDDTKIDFVDPNKVPCESCTHTILYHCASFAYNSRPASTDTKLTVYCRLLSLPG